MFAEMEQFLPQVEKLMRSIVKVDSESEASNDAAGPMCCEHLETGGKRLRARLALAAAKALNVSPLDVVSWAASCELLHNATLVHDDLQDGDTVRRGKPTIWVSHGMAQAINVGDLLWAGPYLAVDSLPEKISEAVKYHLMHTLAHYSACVVRGQANELHLLQNGIADQSFYCQAIRGKTSALFELPVVGAALLAGYSRGEAQAIAAPFTNLGVLFQMQDDVLDLFGDKGRDEVGSDLKEGKISALVAEHLLLHPEDYANLFALLRTPRDETSDADVAAWIVRFREDGALKGVLTRIQSSAEDALAHLVLVSHPELKNVLEDLVRVILKPINHVLGEA